MEAQLLVAHVIERDRAFLRGFPEQRLRAEQAELLRGLVELRAERRPMAQVLGSREFWSLDFQVTADTLAPRPDSETLISCCIDLREEPDPPARILDLGTGTGCLLVTLLTIWSDAVGVGVDRSRAALDVARANARECGADQRASFCEGDWLAGVEGRFDLIVSNPPYIPSPEIETLEPEVAVHEPRLALDGGDDGLACYRALVPGLAEHLDHDGYAVLEHGLGQGPNLEDLAIEWGLAVAGHRNDLSGHRRCLVLKMPAGVDNSKKPLGKQ